MPDAIRTVLARRCVERSFPALIEGATGRSLTWPDVASGVAGWDEVATQGIRVGLALGDPLSMASNYLAALAAGVTIAPLNPEGAPSELGAQARALGLAAIVTDTDVVDITAALADAGCALWRPSRKGPQRHHDDCNIGASGSPSPGSPDVDQAALIMTSSGTTGEPKVIPLTEAQLLHTARGVVRHLELDAHQRGFSPLPLWHINGLVVGVLAAAVSGSSLVVERRFSRRGFWGVVEAQQPTWLNLVPAMLSVLAADDSPPPLHRIRLARSASAPLPEAVRERFERRFAIPVVETYGMTEAASQIAANPLTARRPGSVGTAVGLELRVVDGNGRRVPSGHVGPIQIRGANVISSYRAAAGIEPAERSALTAGGWLPTGDIGQLDADGYLWLVGRDDDVINRGGEKVQPREVEELLASDPRVAAAVVVGRPHPTVGHEPVAYVVAHDGHDNVALVADLGRCCARALSRHKRPADITVLDAMPCGPTGKPRRAELRRWAAGERARHTERSASPVEVVLAAAHTFASSDCLTADVS